MYLLIEIISVSLTFLWQFTYQEVFDFKTVHCKWLRCILLHHVYFFITLTPNVFFTYKYKNIYDRSEKSKSVFMLSQVYIARSEATNILY